jgi:hypothetical protein
MGFAEGKIVSRNSDCELSKGLILLWGDVGYPLWQGAGQNYFFSGCIWVEADPKDSY